jgi:hypothetical protein
VVLSSLAGQHLLVVGWEMSSVSMEVVEDPVDSRMTIVTINVVVDGFANWKSIAYDFSSQQKVIESVVHQL